MSLRIVRAHTHTHKQIFVLSKWKSNSRWKLFVPLSSLKKREKLWKAVKSGEMVNFNGMNERQILVWLNCVCVCVVAQVKSKCRMSAERERETARSVLRRFYFHFICLSCWIGSFYLKHFRWCAHLNPGHQ